jgi:hypothetical protein
MEWAKSHQKELNRTEDEYLAACRLHQMLERRNKRRKLYVVAGALIALFLSLAVGAYGFQLFQTQHARELAKEQRERADEQEKEAITQKGLRPTKQPLLLNGKLVT